MAMPMLTMQVCFPRYEGDGVRPSALRCRGKRGGEHRCGVTSALAVAHRCDDGIGSCTFGERLRWRLSFALPDAVSKTHPIASERNKSRVCMFPAAAEERCCHAWLLSLCLFVCPLMEPREFHLSDCSKESSVCRLRGRGLGAKGTREFLLSSPSQQFWACRLHGLLSTPLS